ncbi:MAG TPA: hypothetical protein VHM70_30555 [Polyangiaceae bacterium]|jgi:hypothetical protein|nr:hypothetical protein [Polyangiaceae bacterium]
MRAQSHVRSVPSLGALGALLLAGCDWNAFNDLEKNAPVVSIDAADSIRVGFGHSLASDARTGHPTVLVGGQPGSSPAAAYDLGTSQEPGGDPTEEGYCSGGRVTPCYLADQPAPVSLINRSQKRDKCFAFAWGRNEGNDNGIVARCHDQTYITLKVPDALRKKYDTAFNRDGEHQALYLASNVADENTLVVGFPEQAAAIFYPGGTEKAHALTLPAEAKAPKSFGAQVAALSLDDTGEDRLLAVAAPDEEVGQVWLFRSKGTDSAVAVGCLGEGHSFGRALGTGDVDNDGVADLVVADERLVTAFSGAKLAELPEAHEAVCSLAALPEKTILASFGCGSAEAASGCKNSQFGAALAVADLDGDGDGEIAVGAPGMDIYSVKGAGAVLVYDVEGDQPQKLSDVLFSSNPQTDDKLGVSVATIAQNGRDVVAAGAPGRSQVDVFFCNEFVPKKLRTGRCAP